VSRPLTAAWPLAAAWPLGAAWIFVAVWTALRLVLIGVVELGDDEAYYWHVATRPSLVFYDHPPVVVWLEAAARALFGDGPGAARLPFVGLGLLSGVVISAWTRRLYGDTAAALALVLTQLVPLFALAAVFVAPDGPSLFATAVAGLAVDGALRGRRGGWLLAGLAVGVGLWCKLTVVLVPLSVAGLMVVGRLSWRRPGPWWAAGVALVLWLPWWVFQADAGWPTVGFHLWGRHGRPGGGVGLLTFVGAQLAYASPLVALVTPLGLLVALRSQAVERIWPVALALPPLVLFVVASAATEARPHWAAAGWLVAVVPVSAWLVARPRWAVATLLVALGLTTVLHTQAVVPVMPLGAFDPTHDAYGWARATPALQARLAGADCLVTGRYQIAAQVGRHMDPPTRVVRHGGRLDQYTLWGDVLDERCEAAVYVDTDRYPSWEGRCDRIDQEPLYRGGEVVRRLRAWRCPAL
jgi:4-amino-4-deoxy-L-arabinose transferase-like glycosyltransferase